MLDQALAADRDLVRALAERIGNVPTGGELASQLAADAVAYSFGPALVDRSGDWWVVGAAAGWLRHSEPSGWLHLAAELGMNSLRPQLWLHMVDEGVYFSPAGEAEFAPLSKGQDLAIEAVPADFVGLDTICFPAPAHR